MAIKPVTTSMKELLPLVRKAFEEKTLQMFTDPNPERIGSGQLHLPRCLYSGPCAIGLLFDKETALEIDTGPGGKSVYDLLERGDIKAPVAEWDDFFLLQDTHDMAVMAEAWALTIEAARKKFAELLEELEAKYLG